MCIRDSYYEKVEWANPSRADLDAMTGEYASDEAEVTLRVALEQDRLVIRRRPDAIIPLTPTYRDGFSSSLGSVRFIRDSGGHVIEMSTVSYTHLDVYKRQGRFGAKANWRSAWHSAQAEARCAACCWPKAFCFAALAPRSVY